MTRKKVLIADDDKSIRELIAILLEDEGYDLIEAGNGNEVVEQTKKHKPDLIILDLMMPQKDGYEALTEIKADPTLVNIPVLIVTARTIRMYENISKNLGAIEHIVKPFSPDELIEKINKALNK